MSIAFMSTKVKPNISAKAGMEPGILIHSTQLLLLSHKKEICDYAKI